MARKISSFTPLSKFGLSFRNIIYDVVGNGKILKAKSLVMVETRRFNELTAVSICPN